MKLTQNKIIRMAREAGLGSVSDHLGFVMFNTAGAKELQRFAAIVAAHEREACAKVCDELKATYELDGLNSTKSYHEAAAAIRARGE